MLWRSGMITTIQLSWSWPTRLPLTTPSAGHRRPSLVERDQVSLPPPARTSEEPGRVNAVARFSGIVCRILKDNNNWSTQQTVDYKQGLQPLQIQLTCCMNNMQGRLFLFLTIVYMNLYGTNLAKQTLQFKG